MPFMAPPAFGYGQPYGPPAGPPTAPPATPGFPPGPQPPGFPVAPYPSPYVPLPLEALEDEEFGTLAEPGPSHWRGDLKWVFGILTVIFLFAVVAVAGMYRVTGPSASNQVLVPLVTGATQVKQKVKNNFKDLRSKARKLKSADILIPDIGVTVTLSASDINSLSSDDLADKVVAEVERQIYSQGYRGNLPMKAAQGTGEERAKAADAMLLSELNKKTHNSLIWPLVICGVLALAFAVLFLVFCNGWGKVIGAGIVFIVATIPVALTIRVMSEFVWKPGTGGTYKAAMYEAFRSIGSLTVIFFDIALGVGALLLLIGIIGNIVSKRSRERVPPFAELQRPAEPVVGGPTVEPGLDVPEEETLAGDESYEAFRDLLPPPGDSIKNP